MYIVHVIRRTTGQIMHTPYTIISNHIASIHHWSYSVCKRQRSRVIWDIHPKRILTPNLAKSRLPIALAPIVLQLCTEDGSITTVLCKNFRTIRHFKRMLYANEISRDLSLIWYSDEWHILHSPLAVLTWQLAHSEKALFKHGRC